MVHQKKNQLKIVNTKIILLLDIIAVIGSMLGASILASNIGYNKTAYFFYLVGGCSTLLLLHSEDNRKSIIFITWFFVCINVVGIMRY